MKRISISIALLLIMFSAKAQSLSNEDFVGDWKVVEMVQEPSHPAFRSMIGAFNGASFTFEEDGSFSLSSTSPGGMFSIMTQATQNASWAYDAEAGMINIGKEGVDSSKLSILVKKEDGKMLFEFKKAEIIVAVEKVEQ